MTAVVVVPVLGRPHRAQPLVDSLRATSDCPLVFVCSRSRAELKQRRACLLTGEQVLIADWPPARADFALKTNLAYRSTTEDWIFCGADDLRFTEGWLEAAIAEGESRRAGVVGTQDQGNPLVKRGSHATHPLVRRAYISEYGGTFDDSGEIYSEAYSHQWVDNELVATAKQRGKWAFAHGSIVEHLHPHWDKAEMDATYEKSMRDYDADRLLYQQRMRLLRGR